MGYEQAVQSYRKTSVETADQIKLIIMCYEQAIRSIRQARADFDQGEFESKARNLGKAQDVINELFSSLNRDKGGEIAVNLAGLYSYMVRRLIQGDMDKDLNAFDEVVRLLEELLAAWQEISTNGKTRAQLPNNYKSAAVCSRGITA